MTAQTRPTLKGYFNTGDVPTEAQFADLIDTFGTLAELVSVSTGEGASLVGIEDSAGYFTGTTVEAALAENYASIDGLDTRLATVEGAYLTDTDVSFYAFDSGGTHTTARPSVAAGSIVYWYNTGGTEPTNLAANDVWEGTVTDPDILKADTSDVLTAGFASTVDDDGTQTTGTYTPDYTTGNFKQITNGGAFTLAPPSPANDNAISVVVLVINNASAGTITTSGFTAVKGDSFDTTNTNKFMCHIDVYDDGGTEYSVLTVAALQ